MDDQDSACIEESVVKRSCQRVRKPFVATGDHRITGWPQQAASQEPGFADFDPQRPRFPLKALAFKATGTYQMEGLGSHHP